MRTHQQEITALGDAARNHNVIVAEDARIRKAGERKGGQKRKRERGQKYTHHKMSGGRDEVVDVGFTVGARLLAVR